MNFYQKQVSKKAYKLQIIKLFSKRRLKMPRKSSKNMDMAMYHGECCASHKTWKGVKMLILGLLVLANVKWAVVDWFTFVGIIIALKGLIKIVKPMHKCM
jgi:uncharacterized membrane protein HdeD (DUF308 family)